MKNSNRNETQEKKFSIENLENRDAPKHNPGGGFKDMDDGTLRGPKGPK